MTVVSKTKISFLCCAFAMIFAFSCVIFSDNIVIVGASDPVPVDIYLVGGQSNAAGYSLKGDLNEAFSNVGYAGSTNFSLSGKTYQSNYTDSFSAFKTSVTAGLGTDTLRIGPEYGMAKAMNDRYEGQRKAFIYKSAAGGTSLRDVNSGLSASYGNWYPRSMWGDYTPSPSSSTDPTGVQYYLFV